MKRLVHSRHCVNLTLKEGHELLAVHVCFGCLTPYGPTPNGVPTPLFLVFSCGSAGKESTGNAQDLGLTPGLGRPPGEGKGYPFLYSGLENSMDCIVYGVTKSRTWLSDFTFHFHSIWGAWSLWSVTVVSLGLPALLNKVGQSGMRNSPCLPSTQVACDRDVRFRNISLGSADCFVKLVWSDSRRKLPPLAHSFSTSSSYGSHYLECFLVGWEMFKLICFDWKMNFSYRVFQSIFFSWGWSQILLLLILRYQLGSKVPLLKKKKKKQRGRNSWNIRGRKRGKGFL